MNDKDCTSLPQAGQNERPVVGATGLASATETIGISPDLFNRILKALDIGGRLESEPLPSRFGLTHVFRVLGTPGDGIDTFPDACRNLAAELMAERASQGCEQCIAAWREGNDSSSEPPDCDICEVRHG